MSTLTAKSLRLFLSCNKMIRPFLQKVVISEMKEMAQACVWLWRGPSLYRFLAEFFMSSFASNSLRCVLVHCFSNDSRKKSRAEKEKKTRYGTEMCSWFPQGPVADVQLPEVLEWVGSHHAYWTLFFCPFVDNIADKWNYSVSVCCPFN